MVSNVSSNPETPVKTVQMFDPQKKQVRKLANKSEIVNEYIKESNKATKKMFVDAGYGAAAAGVGGFSARLLYDGIKRGKFQGMKAFAVGLSAAIAGFFVIAVIEYKKNVEKITKLFIEHSEQTLPLENKFGVIYRIPDLKEDDA